MNLPNWKKLKPWTRHSLVLLVSGVAYMIIGLSYILAKPTDARAIALQFATHPTEWLTLEFAFWGYLFVLVGLITAISSRWPPVSRTWGYTTLTGLSCAWSLFYLFGILFADSPPTNLSGAILWGIFGFLWWSISGLVDPSETKTPGESREAI